MTMPNLLSTSDVAEVLGVDRKTVLRYLASGKLAGHKIGRDYRISEDVLQKFLQDTSTGATVVAEPGLALVTAFANQKGGVAKTTSTLNVGVALHRLGKRVLMVDMDPQASLTVSCGLDQRTLEQNVHHVLSDNEEVAVPADEVIVTTASGPDLLPSTIDLSASEILLVNAYKREYRLRDALAELRERYDHILIDSPPSLGLLTINALAAADQLIIPIQCEYLAMRGMQLLIKNVERARTSLNRDLRIAWILPTMFDTRTVHANEVLDELHKAFSGKVFEPVPQRVAVKEAPVGALSMFDYDPEGPVAGVYMALAKEVSGDG